MLHLIGADTCYLPSKARVMELIVEKYMWAVWMFMTTLNLVVIRYKAKKHIQENPELAKGYDDFLKWGLIIGNTPWVVLGIGVLTGMVDSMWDGFDFGSGNTIAVLFCTIAIVIWLLALVWIMFRDGAEYLAKHHGIFPRFLPYSESNLTAKKVKRSFFFMGILVPMIVITLNLYYA